MAPEAGRENGSKQSNYISKANEGKERTRLACTRLYCRSGSWLFVLNSRGISVTLNAISKGFMSLHAHLSHSIMVMRCVSSLECIHSLRVVRAESMTLYSIKYCSGYKNVKNRLLEV